jgi:hypothetical protein
LAFKNLIISLKKNITTELSTKNWGAAGVYFVKITNSNNITSITKKVIVNRK